MSDLAIETQSLEKHYGSIHALDGLTMRVPRGSIYGFLGRNGAGKTTTIRLLAGLAHPTGGRMQVLGLDPQRDPVVTDQLLRVLVDDFANEGRTLFLSSHHLSEVGRVADWVGIIDHGKLLLEERLDDVRANFRRVRVVGENLAVSRKEVCGASGPTYDQQLPMNGDSGSQP
jgi:ABC-type multidrug transport system ATPase subunit